MLGEKGLPASGPAPLQPSPCAQAALRLDLAPVSRFFRNCVDSGGEQQTTAQQIKTGAAVHLTLEQLELVDVAFGLATFLALQVPELAISAYMLIFVTKENRVLTRLAGVLAIVGITVAIAISLILYGATFDYPVLRIPVMALSVFAGMYLAQVFVVGPLGFAVGFVVAVTQSVADGVPTAEALVCALLWLWVALVYPIAFTVVVNQILLPAEPWTAFVGALMRRLDTASATLHRAAENGMVGDCRDEALLETATRGSGPLLKLLHFAEGKDARLKRRHSSLVAAVAGRAGTRMRNL